MSAPASRPVAVSLAAGRAHLSVMGDTYTPVLRGADTGGAHAVIDMHVPPGHGPDPHAHAFEETFLVLEGEVRVFVAGEAPRTARVGDALNLPAGLPHAFRNLGNAPARLLCIVAPAGLEALFAAVGEPVAHRTAPPPVGFTLEAGRGRMAAHADIARALGVTMVSPAVLGPEAEAAFASRG